MLELNIKNETSRLRKVVLGTQLVTDQYLLLTKRTTQSHWNIS
jgi:hypothetical protein